MEGKHATRGTGLTWEFGQQGSPFKKADELREKVGLMLNRAELVVSSIRCWLSSRLRFSVRHDVHPLFLHPM
jgi:hypothetical protein